jgi:hypothetical protein
VLANTVNDLFLLREHLALGKEASSLREAESGAANPTAPNLSPGLSISVDNCTMDVLVTRVSDPMLFFHPLWVAFTFNTVGLINTPY